MSNMIAAAKEQVATLTQQAYEKAAAAGLLPAGAAIKGSVDIPKDPTHGDYATSFALAGAKALGMATLYMHTALTPPDQNPADPACHPTVAGLRHWEYEGDDWNELVELIENLEVPQ